jgi:hypothetical protein
MGVRKGEGVVKDLVWALECYKRCADQGNSGWMAKYGMSLAKGDRFRPDPVGPVRVQVLSRDQKRSGEGPRAGGPFLQTRDGWRLSGRETRIRRRSPIHVNPKFRHCNVDVYHHRTLRFPLDIARNEQHGLKPSFDKMNCVEPRITTDCNEASIFQKSIRVQNGLSE